MKNEALIFREKSLMPYYGGKYEMLQHILPLIPDHLIYVEPFVGGGSVFFAKTPAKNNTILNDLNLTIMNFYRQLSLNKEALIAEISATLYHRWEYNRARRILKGEPGYSDLERAWAVFIVVTQGYLGSTGSWCSQKEDIKAVDAYFEKLNLLPLAAAKLRKAQIECRDANEIIKIYDGEDVFFYIDPPYFNSDCKPYKTNPYMQADYERLLELLGGLRGRFLLSGYPSEPLAAAVERNGWKYKEFERCLRASCQNKDVKRKLKTETLTYNYSLKQGSLWQG